MALEKEHERAGNRYAVSRGWRIYKLQFLGRRGATDRMYCRKPDGVFFIEWKKPGEEPTEQQVKRHTEMREAGLRVLWFDCVEKFIAWIDEFDNDESGF